MLPAGEFVRNFFAGGEKKTRPAGTSYYVEEGFTLLYKSCSKSSNLKQLWLEG